MPIRQSSITSLVNRSFYTNPTAIRSCTMNGSPRFYWKRCPHLQEQIEDYEPLIAEDFWALGCPLATL